MNRAEKILNQVEPNGELLTTDLALEAVKETAIRFATWYSGMDRNKVERQFNKWNEQVEPGKDES